MSPNPNFIPPRLSEAIHLPGWIPGKGGIKSSKHKQREEGRERRDCKLGKLLKKGGICRIVKRKESAEDEY